MTRQTPNFSLRSRPLRLMLNCESITHAVNSLRVDGILWPRFDLLPDTANVDVDAALCDAAVITPDAIQELVPGERHSRMTSQVMQQAEFERAQLDLLARNAHAVG